MVQKRVVEVLEAEKMPEVRSYQEKETGQESGGQGELRMAVKYKKHSLGNLERKSRYRQTLTFPKNLLDRKLVE